MRKISRKEGQSPIFQKSISKINLFKIVLSQVDRQFARFLSFLKLKSFLGKIKYSKMTSIFSHFNLKLSQWNRLFLEHCSFLSLLLVAQQADDFLLWSLSPRNMNTNGNANVFDVDTNGNLNNANVNNTNGAVAPATC